MTIAMRPAARRAPVRLALPLVALLAGGFAAALPPAPAVELRNGARPGSLELRAARPTALAPRLIVERQLPDGSFAPVRNLDLDSLHLVAACDRPARGCVTVDARGLRPVPWSGMSCSSQCHRACDKNEALHGRFRFVATSCDGRTRFEGAVFAL